MARKHNIILSLLIACSLYVSLFLVYQTKSSIHSKTTTSKKPDESSPSALLLIGAGNVGYPLLHALALDRKTSNTFSKIIILDAQPEKPDEIQFLQQELHMEYKYIQGDMRDEFLLHQIFNETHIKGVIVLAAVSRVMWCEIEKETCQQINTHAIRILMKQITLSNSNPWIIFASSREVYGAVKEFPITETTQMNPLNLYGRTKMKAEHILTSYNKKPLHKIILRFSSIYGGKYDHSDRLIPSMIRSMLNDQPIPFSGSNQEFDFTYIDDVVDAIKLAIHQAEELTSSSVDVGTLTKYNICSGELTSVKKLYQIIKYLTNSYSPVIMFDNNGVFPDKYEASTKYAADKLGFKARVNIRNGLLAYIHQIYTLSHQQIQKQLQISTSFNENEDIKSLDECSVVFNFKNQAHEFNLTVFKENNTVVIPALDVGPKTITENNKTIIIESGPSQFILKVDSFSKSLVLLDAKEPSKYYEMDKKSSTEWDSKSYPYKIHIHCCPNLINYPFSSFSPYFLSNIDYPQRNNPTLLNEKLEQSIKYKTQAIQRLVDLRTGKFDEDNILSNSTSMNANDWTQSSKDYCETNCNNVIPCLKRDNCRCVINEQCSHSSMSIPSFITSSPLYDQRLSLLSVYGRSLGMKWPKIYVHDFEQTHKFLANSNCGKQLNGGHCFSMDAVLYYSFKNISVPIEQADVVMLPYFHGCSHHYGLHIAIDSYILKELDNLKAKYPNKIFTTMASHDFGGCGEFWWSYLHVNNPKQKESHFKMVTIQPNGDYFSKCYIPEKDIVAPPRTCLTNRLIEKFGDEKSVKKVTERKHLVFFEGSLFGTGKVTRRTLKECSNVFGFIPKNQYSDYLEMLSETKFCPLVAGTTGWATRNSDVIYAGCIPVYLSEYTHQPFANLLDYSKFSIQIHPSQVYNLKHILESISEERRIELQRNLLMIRDLMIYKNEESVKEWSPQDMVLRELYIRLKTRFETK